jgi:hypothetical protein
LLDAPHLLSTAERSNTSDLSDVHRHGVVAIRVRRVHARATSSSVYPLFTHLARVFGAATGRCNPRIRELPYAPECLIS